MKRVIRIALSGMPLADGNLGVGALATSTIYLIKQVAKKNNWDLLFYHLSFRKGANHLEIDGENVTINNVLYNRCNYIKGFIWHCLHPEYFISEWRLRKMDCLLDISGGDSYSDIYGAKRFFYEDSIKRFFRFFNVPQLMLPQTIGPFANKKVKKEAIESVETTDVVLTRDRQSYEWVKSNTQQQNIFEVIDVAFFMPYTRMNFDKSQIHVGLNVSALLWNGGYTKNNQFNLKVDYPNLIRSIIDQFVSIPNVVLHLIPHVIGSDEGGVENDYWVATRIHQSYNNPNIVVAPYFFSPIEAKNYISGMDFFMGARMHSCIAAFSSGVPVVPMAYSRKFNGLFEDTLSYSHMIDMTKETDDQIMKKVADAFENRENLRRAINSQKDLINNRKELLLQQIEQFLKK